MTAVTIQIEGIDAVIDKIDSLQRLEQAGQLMLAIGTHVKGKVDKYPASTEANSPREYTTGGRNTWYQRGYGPKWARKDGSVGGRKTSETLGRRWTVQMRDAGRSVVIGNNVSYGPYVQDEENQADFHKRNGWPTIQQVAKDEEPTIRAFVEDYLKRLLG